MRITVIDGPMPSKAPTVSPREPVVYRQFIKPLDTWRYHGFINMTDEYVSDDPTKTTIRYDMDLSRQAAEGLDILKVLGILYDNCYHDLAIAADVDGEDIPGMGQIRRK